MALDFEEWFEVHKSDVFRCYAKKGSGFNQDCHADEHNLEHINAHDHEHALRIFQDYVNIENNKEEARKQKEAQEKRLDTIEKMLSQLIKIMKQMESEAHLHLILRARLINLNLSTLAKSN